MEILENLNLYKFSVFEQKLFKEVERLFIESLKNNGYLTATQIVNCLKLKYKDINYETVLKILSLMQIQLGMIGREDFIGSEPKFCLLPEVYYNSKWSKIYSSFKGDQSLKKVLLISDTHIGSDIYNPKLIHNMYNFSKKKNVSCIFHLGDLFEGTQNSLGDMDEFKRQMKLFLNEYPNTSNDGIMTYAIKGNHDIKMEYFLNKYNLDLRVLSNLNNSFYMFPKRVELYRYSFQTLIVNNFKIKMSHESYAGEKNFNSFNPYSVNKDINTIFDFDKIDRDLNSIYQLLISGHRHMALATNVRDENFPINNLYLSVPSLSSLSAGKCVGVILNFEYNKDIVSGINIQVLYCDKNFNIGIKDEFYFDYTKEVKVFKKKL